MYVERVFGTRKQCAGFRYPATPPLFLTVVTYFILRLSSRRRAQAISGIIIDTIFVDRVQVETAGYGSGTRGRLPGGM